jgi:Ca2+-binding RTX toxin-like protein
MPGPRARLGALAGALIVLSAAPAQAATVRVERGDTTDGRGYPAATAEIVYDAAPGEVNRLSISVVGETATVVDRVAVAPGAGCTRPNAASPGRATCNLHLVPSVSQVGVFNFARLGLGDGDDSASVSSLGTEPYDLITGTPDVVSADAGAGNDTVTVAATARLAGGPGNDKLQVTQGSGRLAGGAGNDRLIGGPGADMFESERGLDGADVMQGGSGFDTASYANRRQGVRADLDGDADDGAPGEGDQIDIHVEAIEGGAGGDRLDGDRRANTLIGKGGRDRLDGGRGEDRLEGGPGSDRILARDNRTDLVRCGAGGDIARIDGFDLAYQCESVRRNRPPRAVLDPAGARFQEGFSVNAAVLCPRDAPGRCRGRALFRAAGQTLGSSRFSIRRGGSREVTIRLTKTGPLVGQRRLRGRFVILTRRAGARALSVRSGFTVGDPGLDTAGGPSA